MPKISDLVAQPGFAPREWQVAAPISVFGRGEPVADSPDLERVLALPRRPQLDLDSPRAQALVELITQRYTKPNHKCECRSIDPHRPCITKLLPVQAWSLYEIGITSGLLGAIYVGAGKTILDILTPLALPDCKLALLLVPPNLIDQLVIDYRLLSQHFHVPSIRVHEDIWTSTVPGNVPILHVLPYSRLSLPGSSNWIEQLCPDAIIADECDRLKDLTAATTSRVMRHFANHGDTRFCGWTGSLTDSSLKEYCHLAVLALRYASPLPLELDIAEDWGRALDAIPNPAPPGALLKLCNPGENVRSGFRRRLVETMGVVVVDRSDVQIEGTKTQIDLVVRERKAPAIPAAVQECLKQVRNSVRPDGEELVDALSVAKCAVEVACGIYYRWIFPRGEPASLILEWLEARKNWNKELRFKLLDRHEYLDSPHLAEMAAQRAWGDRPQREDRPEWKAKNWPRWRDIRVKVKPKTQAVRIHDYLVRDAAEWASKNRGIVWYSMVEFGTWLAELSGLTMHTGGHKAGERIRNETGQRSIIASLKSHGRGRDGLQRLYDKQLIANVPSSATIFEQALGRLHRRGQNSSEVITEIYAHTKELQKNIAQALRRAKYVQGTLGATQKLTKAWEGDD